MPTKQDDWLVILLLAIFLGGFGVHQFYTGNNGKGVAILLLSLLCGVGFIWVIYDIIMIATGKFKRADGSYVER